MTTVVNTTPATENNSSMGMFLGLIFLLIVVFLFFFYGLPMLRGASQQVPNKVDVQMPDKVDVNVKTNPQQ